ncbi:hypothetical protein [Ruminiclostridium josui]|nr:hypothetical protein [Ruminiclostridium josui]
MVNKITVYDSKDVLPETGATLENTENGCIVIEYNYSNWKQQTDRK